MQLRTTAVMSTALMGKIFIFTTHASCSGLSGPSSRPFQVLPGSCIDYDLIEDLTGEKATKALRESPNPTNSTPETGKQISWPRVTTMLVRLLFISQTCAFNWKAFHRPTHVPVAHELPLASVATNILYCKDRCTPSMACDCAG